MKHRTAPIAMIALLSVSSLACDKPGVSERQKETNASEEARNAANEAQRHMQSAQAEAEKTISTARADFETTREDYLHRRRLDLIELDAKIANIDANARTATSNTKADVQARLSAIGAQRTAFAHHLQTLDTATGATWDSSRASLDEEWDALKKAVDDAG